jgi:glutamate dehydrogenase/leucine dehydrogenase
VAWAARIAAVHSAWGTYLAQIDRVVPYLGRLARWAETLRHPKRALIVDIPIEMDDGTVATSRATACSTTSAAARARAACAITPM